MKKHTIIFLILLLSACSSIQRYHELTPKPVNYTDYEPSYFWTFVARQTIKDEEACSPLQTAQTRRYHSTEDILIWGFTLGIYSPRSVQIWCIEETKDQSTALMH